MDLEKKTLDDLVGDKTINKESYQAYADPQPSKKAPPAKVPPVKTPPIKTPPVREVADPVQPEPVPREARPISKGLIIGIVSLVAIIAVGIFVGKNFSTWVTPKVESPPVDPKVAQEVDPRWVGPNRITALHLAVQNDRLDHMQQLIAANADVNAQMSDGTAPLHIALRMGHSVAAQRLLDCPDIRVSVRDSEGRTPLTIAVDKGLNAMVTALLDKGADLESKDNQGLNALHVAAGNGDLEIVKILLDHGAAKDVTTASGATAVDLARQAGHESVAELIEPTIPEAPPSDSAASSLTNEGTFSWVVPAGYVRASEPEVIGSRTRLMLTSGNAQAFIEIGPLTDDLLKYPTETNERWAEKPDYTKVALESTTFKGRDAVLWEYEREIDGVQKHCRTYYFTHQGNGYALSMRAPVSEWSTYETSLRQVEDSLVLNN